MDTISSFLTYLSNLEQQAPLTLLYGAAIVIAAIAGAVFVIIYKWRKDAELKYEFVTIIGHKFRTPLSHIKYVSELLIENESDPSKIDSLRELEKANTNLIGLTGTLLELAQSKSQSKTIYSFQDIPLCKTARDISDSLRSSFKEKNISFAVQCAETEINVHSDMSRLEFVLQTVFENSFIYTPSGGKVDVVVSREKHMARVDVIDNGIGIEPSELPRIFSKFHRAENARRFDTEGLGVGLYLTKTIMNRLHGKISVFSEGKDRGTTFTVMIPLARYPHK